MYARGSATDELSTTQAALDSLGRSICIGLFLVAGVWCLVLPPADGAQRWAAATVSLLAAAGMWAISSRTGTWAAYARWVLPPLTIVALAGLQLAAGDAGWWLPLETAAMGALMATAMMQPPLRSAVAALVMMVATIVPAVVAPAPSVDSAGLTSYRALQLFIAYAISLVGSVGLRRAEQRAGAQRRESDEALLAELRKQSRSDAQNSLQRVLHDTALNTLEAVANGVPEQRWRQLRRRCAADVAAVDRMADVGPPTEVATLLQNLSDQGIGIEADVEWLSDPPALVQEVVLAAVEEAVRNAAKHSGAQVVQLRALVTADSLVVEVVDGGAGFEVTQPGRLGVQASIVASMESVGGYAVVASEPGLGTRVSLRWDRARRQLASMMSGMRRRLVRVFAAAAAVSLLSFMIFTVTDPGLASPGLRIAAIVVTAAMVLILVRSALHGGVGRIEFLIVLVGLALLTLLLPWSDPYCASFQSSYPFDLRALLMSTIALTVVRARQLVMALTVLVVGSAFGNAVWLQLGSSCGWTYLMISGVAATIAIGAFGFAQNMDSQRSLLAAKVVSAEQDFGCPHCVWCWCLSYVCSMLWVVGIGVVHGGVRGVAAGVPTYEPGRGTAH
jgi:signal transduction histidine kinase